MVHTLIPVVFVNKNVNKNQEAILCSNCAHWIHIKCNVTSMDYNQMMEYNSTLIDGEIENYEWLCNKCQILKTSHIFPYGLESNIELLNINYADSMKSLENLPTFDITSQAANFDSLKQYDIDDNIIDNLNSRYYSAQEFQSLTANNTFNVFHTNLAGLESKFDLLCNFINNTKFDLLCNFINNTKFDLLCNFINNTKIDLDIICLSETSQKSNQGFDPNITIGGYKQPFTTGSKFSKGSVALYTKDNIKCI